MDTWVGLRAAIAAAAAALALTACGSGEGNFTGLPGLSSHPATPADCRRQQAHVAPGAPEGWGFTVGDATTPDWSVKGARAGASVDGRVLVPLADGCVTALDARSGEVAWTRPVGGRYSLMGVVAGASVVVVATGHSHGTAPAMVYPATDRIVALDPQTGARRWSRRIGSDGQGVPATIAGTTVIVAEADGAVLGLDAASGVRRWRAAPPRACATSRPDDETLNPAAVVLTGPPVPTIRYSCGRRHLIVRVTPATGAVRWARTLPALRSEEIDWYPAAATRDVVGLVLAGRAAEVAPLRGPAPPGPRGYATDTFLALDAATGAPLWQLDDVPATAVLYAGAGQLCFVHGYGTGCYDARSGLQTWHREPFVVPTMESGTFGDGVVAAAGRLYQVVPTAAAASIPAGSTTYRSRPGTFHLQVTAMATGRILREEPLPAYYGGPDGVVVSADTPPGVLAVDAGTVLVSPQLHESDVTEAFASR